MSKHNDITNFGTVTPVDVDRAIRRAHQLRADETVRMARAVGRRVRAIFGH